MGYSEIYCQICGVSFNISRARTDKEPRSATWGQERAFPYSNYPDDCIEREGCFFVKRNPYKNASATSDTGFSESVKISPGDLETTGAFEYMEHVVGPDCEQSEAYNGHRISAEAMRGCTTVQCLVRKPEDWEPEPDDEPFEAEGHFFLSGVSGHMPSRDMSCPSTFPKRHECSEPDADNIIWDTDRAEDCAMPFHPTCLEVFKRASLQRYGVVDLECLTQWWGLEATYEDFHAFPRHPAVKSGQEQCWNHNPGDEFLAANPCFVPGLEAILSSAQCLKGSCSEVTPTAVSTRPAPADLFARLPREIRLFILLQLGFGDIANLRLASRTFLQLPQSLFYPLTLRELPWLYEAWSSLPISFWATTTAADEEKEQEDLWRRQDEVRSRVDELGEEGVEEEMRRLPGLASAPRPATSVILLNRAETDWYRLQAEIGRNWKKLPGLQNRRRIWDDCQEILDRVDAYRKQGKINRGGAIDVTEVARQSEARQMEEMRRWERYCAAEKQGQYIPEDWD